MSTGAHAEIQLENSVFRVTQWTIEPGGHIPMHTHEHEYVVVPMVTDRMHVVLEDGNEIVSDLVAGVSYTRPAGSRHQVENRESAHPIVFIEIESVSPVTLG